MNPRYMYLGGFVITVGVISYYDIAANHELPWPPRIVATGIVFTMLDLFSGFSPELSGVLAIGFMLAMIVNKKLIQSSTKHCNCIKTPDASATLPNVPIIPIIPEGGAGDLVPIVPPDVIPV